MPVNPFLYLGAQIVSNMQHIFNLSPHIRIITI